MDKNINKKTKLSVMDFDGTLIDSPLPEYGKAKYKSVTGKEWPHKGWWSKPESLDTSIFDIKPVPSVVADYEEEKVKDNVITAMLTGRMITLSNEVRTLLDTHKLTFDEYHYNKGGSTEVGKMKTMEQLLEKYKDVVEIQMWDDNLGYAHVYEEWGKKQCLSGRLQNFSITVVISENNNK